LTIHQQWTFGLTRKATFCFSGNFVNLTVFVTEYRNTFAAMRPQELRKAKN